MYQFIVIICLALTHAELDLEIFPAQTFRALAELEILFFSFAGMSLYFKDFKLKLYVGH